MTDPEFLNTVAPLAEEFSPKAAMIPHQEGKTIGNVVMDAGVVGFSSEAIDLIRLSKVISGDMALVEAWDSIEGATFSWIGPSTSMLPVFILTTTSETASFDFSKFQQIPNDVPGYSRWLHILGLDQHDLGLDQDDEV